MAEKEYRVDPQLFQDCVDLWGEQFQLEMCIEECGELIVAAQHIKRGRCTILEVYEEIADVYVMMKQMQFIDPDTFESCLQKKVEKFTRQVAEGKRKQQCQD
ncbi:hypothetical protein KAR91_74110 [Candidatus Pacearchaeota archaeon]|nr:hypothetical protein [Candidatus Pacearchaeota archaeon]